MDDLISMTKCERNHEALKLNLTDWTSLKLIGYQEVPGDENEADYKLELRNCSCGSTLAIEIR